MPRGARARIERSDGLDVLDERPPARGRSGTGVRETCPRRDEEDEHAGERLGQGEPEAGPLQRRDGRRRRRRAVLGLGDREGGAVRVRQDRDQRRGVSRTREPGVRRELVGGDAQHEPGAARPCRGIDRIVGERRDDLGAFRAPARRPRHRRGRSMAWARCRARGWARRRERKAVEAERGLIDHLRRLRHDRRRSSGRYDAESTLESLRVGFARKARATPRARREARALRRNGPTRPGARRSRRRAGSSPRRPRRPVLDRCPAAEAIREDRRARRHRRPDASGPRRRARRPRGRRRPCESSSHCIRRDREARGPGSRSSPGARFRRPARRPVPRSPAKRSRGRTARGRSRERARASGACCEGSSHVRTYSPFVRSLAHRTTPRRSRARRLAAR